MPWPTRPYQIVVLDGKVSGFAVALWNVDRSPGRYVAFSSTATNLVPGDSNGREDVFVHDRLAMVTARVSVATGGGEGNGNSNVPVITPDARYIVFSSDATNLVPDDTNGVADIFRHDRRTGQTVRVSGNSLFPLDRGSFGFQSVSADGRRVAYVATGRNLFPSLGYILLADLSTGAVEFLNVGGIPTLSADASRIAFVTPARITPEDQDSLYDAYLYDRESATYSLMSSRARNQVVDARISGDGQSVVYVDESWPFSPNGFQVIREIYHSRFLGRFEELIATPLNEGGAEGGPHFYVFDSPSVSFDGGFVAYRASELPYNVNPTREGGQVFVLDRSTGERRSHYRWNNEREKLI